MTQGEWKLAGGALVLLAVLLAVQGLLEPRAEPTDRPGRADSPGPYGDCVAFGQSMQFNMSVQSKLRNPPSFDHVRSEIGPVQEGIFPVVMTYRATNGFGGTDTGLATGEVRVSDCAAKVMTLG
jgi:hypothetical protein